MSNNHYRGPRQAQAPPSTKPPPQPRQGQGGNTGNDKSERPRQSPNGIVALLLRIIPVLLRLPSLVEGVALYIAILGGDIIGGSCQLLRLIRSDGSQVAFLVDVGGLNEPEGEELKGKSLVGALKERLQRIVHRPFLDELRRLAEKGVRIRAIVLTHAHFDHIGKVIEAVEILDKCLSSRGALIYCSRTTERLLWPQWETGLRLDAERRDERLRADGKVPPRPEETAERIARTLAMLKERVRVVDWETDFCPDPDEPWCVCRFKVADHTPGAAMVLVRGFALPRPESPIIREENGRRWDPTMAHSFLHMADFGQPGQRVTRPVDEEGLKGLRGEVSGVVAETTYAVDHPARDGAERRLVRFIAGITARGGRVLIPVFALGRSQEIVRFLRTHRRAILAETEALLTRYARRLERGVEEAEGARQQAFEERLVEVETRWARIVRLLYQPRKGRYTPGKTRDDRLARFLQGTGAARLETRQARLEPLLLGSPTEEDEFTVWIGGLALTMCDIVEECRWDWTEDLVADEARGRWPFVDPRLGFRALTGKMRDAVLSFGTGVLVLPSGMCHAALSLLALLMLGPDDGVAFVGYAAPGTPADLLPKTPKGGTMPLPDGTPYVRRCKVIRIGGLSAHTGASFRAKLIGLLQDATSSLWIVLLHGDPETRKAVAKDYRSRGWRPIAPEAGQTVVLKGVLPVQYDEDERGDEHGHTAPPRVW